MIQFETDSSAFFVANKNYCQAIETQLKSANLVCSGFCNSYGYEFDTRFQKNNLVWHLKFLKYQNSENGVTIPENSHEYFGTEVTVTGLDKKTEVNIGKSSFRRFFMSKQFQNIIQKPYFISFNGTPEINVINMLVKTITDNLISTFKLRNGKLVCKIHEAITNPLKLNTDMDEAIKTWV